jgi:hypothetical protein
LPHLSIIRQSRIQNVGCRSLTPAKHDLSRERQIFKGFEPHASRSAQDFGLLLPPV